MRDMGRLLRNLGGKDEKQVFDKNLRTLNLYDIELFGRIICVTRQWSFQKCNRVCELKNEGENEKSYENTKLYRKNGHIEIIIKKIF
jgi:hypothetical protein